MGARKLTKRTVTVTVEPLTYFDIELRDDEVESLGAFRNRQALLRIGRLA